MSDKLMDVCLVWFGILLWALKELTMDSEKNRGIYPTSNPQWGASFLRVIRLARLMRICKSAKYLDMVQAG